MTTFTVRLRSRQDIAHGTTAFRFDQPDGFGFKPGQAIDLILPEPPAGVAVAGLRGTLGHAGVDDDDIRSEEFYGY